MLSHARSGTPGLVSIVVPSRNERFLVPTVNDLLAKAAGSIEIIAVLDGYWPDPPLPDDPRIRVLHFGEAKGMRPAINAAVAIANGEFILKADAHTLWAEGYDRALIADYHERNWIVVPRRYALDPEAWAIDSSNRKYPVDYHFISSPFHVASNSNPGLHGSPWTARRDARKHIELDDELSSQGSAYFVCRDWFNRIGPLDSSAFGNFVHEFQEVGLRSWLMGGAVKTLKRTNYSHLFKGKRWGRGYSLTGSNHDRGSQFCTWFFMNEIDFPGRVRSFRSVIEQFSPVPTWSPDLSEFNRASEFRNPYVAAA